MIEIDTPEISIDKIMARIQQEVKRHQSTTSSQKNTYCSFTPCPHISLPPPFPTLEPLPPQERYTLGSLLKYQDMDFIYNAYTAILRRPPDSEGGAIYLEMLHNGTLSKIDILGRLRYSSEGKGKKVQVKGLFFRFLFALLRKIPILGRLIHIITSIVNLPTVLKNIQTLENTLYVHHRLAREEAEEIRSHLAGLSQHIELLQKEITRSQKAYDKATDKKIEISSNELKKISDNVHNNALEVLNLQHTMQIFLEETEKKVTTPHSGKSERMLKEKNHLMDAMYVEFENQFRGDKKDIKERARVYLPHIQKPLKATLNSPILDVGSGRGEWLELLNEENIKASGVDLNRIMVSQCREQGLDVTKSDAIVHLKAMEANSLSVITGFHIIEHIPFETLINLFDEALRVLKPGGMAIFETPNPENILVGSCTFYTDPTHNRPIPPQTAAHFMEARGFVDIEIMRLHQNETIHLEDPFLSHQFTVGQDYAIMGIKS